MKKGELNQEVKWALAKLNKFSRASGDIYAVKTQELSLVYRDNKLEKAEEAISRSMTVRIFYGKRSGISSSSNLSKEGIELCLERAYQIAQYTEEDPAAGLADDPAQQIKRQQLDLYQPAAIENISRQEKISIIKKMEKEARKDKRITASNGSHYYQGQGISVLADSRGFFSQSRGTNYGLYLGLVAADKDGTKREGYDYQSRVSFADLSDYRQLASKASRRAIEQLGAKPLETGTYSVLLNNDIAPRFISALVGSLNGTSFYKKTSIFIGKEGKQIASPLLSISDDPLIVKGLGSRHFDGEGYPSRKNILLEKGRLKGILLDSYSARKLGRKTTASASRGRGSGCYPGTTNLIVKAGDSSPEQLAGSVDKLLWIKSLLGFQYNAVTGDFSSGARGFLYKKGKRVGPVSEITFSGNLAKSLLKIRALGNDPYLNSSFRTPSILIDEITVSGK